MPNSFVEEVPTLCFLQKDECGSVLSSKSEDQPGHESLLATTLNIPRDGTQSTNCHLLLASSSSTPPIEATLPSNLRLGKPQLIHDGANAVLPSCWSILWYVNNFMNGLVLDGAQM